MKCLAESCTLPFKPKQINAHKWSLELIPFHAKATCHSWDYYYSIRQQVFAKVMHSILCTNGITTDNLWRRQLPLLREAQQLHVNYDTRWVFNTHISWGILVLVRTWQRLRLEMTLVLWPLHAWGERNEASHELRFYGSILDIADKSTRVCLCVWWG